ncbi:Chromatin assembly factor 1 subunit A [Dillenia turbinata]|uniref:Chromatin assembly factor 1 subunit A n=1 Tax=Dillenia turbinata TaxID=194707 RepID=A0AAN8U7N8_9MAGN
MADSSMLIDDNPTPTPPSSQSKKRKRMSEHLLHLSLEDRTSRIDSLRREMDALFKYYNDSHSQKWSLVDAANHPSSGNAFIACSLEESSLPFSKLVDRIYPRLKARDGDSVTIASVKSSVLLVGQRWSFGVPNPDVDVLEDESPSCLWCWEVTRDLKLLPKTARGALKIRRTFRKKIHERILALSAIITALQKSGTDQNCHHELMKASEKLGKVLNEEGIRLLVEGMEQKNGTDITENAAKREEKLLARKIEKNQREVEKENKKKERELQKEKLEREKEQKRLQIEAEKDERRREKEEFEMKKQLRKQQGEAEKDQRRREKEEAELKKQLSIQKQASMMERFLKRSKSNSISPTNQPSERELTSNVSSGVGESNPHAVTVSMDIILSLENQDGAEDLWKSHLISWHKTGQSMCSKRKQHWGLRRKPKTELYKEPKLTTGREIIRDNELNLEKPVDGWGEVASNYRLGSTDADTSLPCAHKHGRSKQLLQFDKSYRPAFYGIWPKKSHVVGPRCPLKRDPELDYDVDSDEEWEEEDPGESLSDCDKDDEEENLEEGYSKVDEEESEDGFFVPDGYLSENEGVEVDRLESDIVLDEPRSPPVFRQDSEDEKFSVLLRQQKYLQDMTDHALRKNQPLIILNLMHEKTPLLIAEDLSGTAKLEHMCLQALRMCLFPGGVTIEAPIDEITTDDQIGCPPIDRESVTPSTTVPVIEDSDLPQIVSVILSCSHSISKVLQSLQQRFPAIPKSQLRNKVRELSDFVDNRWQVKKDILDKLGLSISPEKNRTKSIAAFFSKRCMPTATKQLSTNNTFS